MPRNGSTGPKCLTKANTLTENTNTTDDLPEFDEAAVRAEITTPFDPNRAMEAGRAAPRSASNAPATFKASMLSPEDRAPIMQQLARISDPAEREATEARLVEPVVRRYAALANIRRGCPGGTAYEQEYATILNEVERLEDEAARIRTELGEVGRYEVRADSETGKPTAVPVLLYSGTERARREDRLRSIAGHVLALSEGEEGKRRLAKAADAEVAKRRSAYEDLRIHKIAEARAASIIAEERIAVLAESKAKMMRPTGGF